MALATPGNAAEEIGADAAEEPAATGSRTGSAADQRVPQRLLGGRIHRVHGIDRVCAALAWAAALVRTGGQRLHNLLVITSPNFTTARRSVVTDRQPESVGIAF